MLIRLDVKNIALVESLSMEFGSGFHVLTGETGAGKSIVVDCIELVLGCRADRDLIRTGTEKAEVSAVFDISRNEAAMAILGEYGIEDDGGDLIVTREISRSGRNLSRLNGTPVTLAQLQRVSACLMDVHGQHEHQQLIDPATHLSYLDAFGGDGISGAKRETERLYAVRSKKASLLKKLMRESEELKRQSELTKARTEDVEQLRIKPGDKEKLESRLTMLSRADEIREKLAEAYALLSAGTERTSGAESMIRSAADALSSLSDMDAEYAKMAERLTEAFYTVQDVSRDVEGRIEKTDSDPSLMERVQNKLQDIYRLEKRYGADAEELIRLAAESRADDDRIGQLDLMIREGKAEYRALDAQLREKCAELTGIREKLGASISQAVSEQLDDLGMRGCVFEPQIRQLEKPRSSGMDEVEFMISANVGEPVKPLASVASGGELSRIMLALKTVTGGRGVDSMVFDEIDTGISGRTAAAVGKKMKAISALRQVICVTHHASIAAMADVHFKVDKAAEGGRTRTVVTGLSGEERIGEIMRLIDGGAGGDKSRGLAVRMLEDPGSL